VLWESVGTNVAPLLAISCDVNPLKVKVFPTAGTFTVNEIVRKAK
jgi:hypothetical protein